MYPQENTKSMSPVTQAVEVLSKEQKQAAEGHAYEIINNFNPIERSQIFQKMKELFQSDHDHDIKEVSLKIESNSMERERLLQISYY